MSRPVDWQPLSDRDPVPGDPVALAGLARHYRETAEAIRAAADGLRRIIEPSTGLIGKSVAAFAEKAEEVASDIERAHGRYAATGQALTEYEPVLDDAQARSLAALSAAQQAQADIDDANRRADVPVPDGADPAAVEAADTERRRAEGDAADAEGRLGGARRKLEEAVADRDRAAERAAGAIKDVMDHDDLGDSWWDNWGAKVVATIADVAGVVATVCGILSLVVGWIPIVGQALAAVLGAIALVASVISLVANLALYLTGKGDLMSVVLDAISVATFGLGRVASSAARVSYRGLRGATRLSAGRQAAHPVAGQSSARILRQLAGDAAGMSRGAARGLVRRANRQGLVPPGDAIWRSLRSTGSDFADGAGTLRSADWGTVVRNLPSDFRATFAGTGDDGARAFFARLYGDPDGATDAIGHRAIPAAIRADAEVASQANRAVAQHVTQIVSGLTGSGVDGYQGYTNIVSPMLTDNPTPAQQVNLPPTPVPVP